MNTRVTQMIELLFRDVQPSEEVQALYEEVQNNCQDRFEDLVRNGLSEEEALAAVMESLKGMEDVLKEYPRREAKTEDENIAPEQEKKQPEAKKPEEDSAAFGPEAVRAIQAQLTGCDVEVVSGGEKIVLEKQGAVHYELQEDGTLRIWQERATENLFRGISWEESFSSFDHFGDAMNRLAQNVSQLISGKIGRMSEGSETRLVLRLPEGCHPQVRLRTTGGDISWKDAVPGEGFVLGTTSGDIRVSLDQGVLLPETEISSTSGDAELHMSAATVRVNTVSGDITWDGDAGVLETNSTSGDTDASGRIRMMNLNATSGDLSLELADDLPAEVKANTVSGSVHVRLKGERKEAAAKLQSVSGEIRTHGVDLTQEAPVTIEANTVSGSLRISG